jgi:hypothetical protein
MDISSDEEGNLPPSPEAQPVRYTFSEAVPSVPAEASVPPPSAYERSRLAAFLADAAVADNYAAPAGVFRERECLRPEGWLTDEVIDYYLGLVARRSASPGARDAGFPSVFACSSLMFVQLGGARTTERWYRETDVFGHDLVLMPFNASEHWVVGVVAPGKKTIYYCDSFNVSNRGIHDEFKTKVMKFMKETYAQRGGPGLVVRDWKVVQVLINPPQRNGYDCGVYVCLVAELFSRNINPAGKFPYSLSDARRRIALEMMAGHLAARPAQLPTARAPWVPPASREATPPPPREPTPPPLREPTPPPMREPTPEKTPGRLKPVAHPARSPHPKRTRRPDVEERPFADNGFLVLQDRYEKWRETEEPVFFDYAFNSELTRFLEQTYLSVHLVVPRHAHETAIELIDARDALGDKGGALFDAALRLLAACRT